MIDQISDQAKKLCNCLNVVGLANIQFAIAADKIYIIEANPRASRTVPFISKATGNAFAQEAVKLMLGY